MPEHDGLRRTLIVASREMVERGKSPAFRISTLIAIVAMAAIILFPSLLSDDTTT